MTENQPPLPDASPDNDQDAELRALAARYFDLWQENWAAFLGPAALDEPEPT